MTQREAADAAGNMSEVWWRTIESGRADYATSDALARMAYAVGITPDQLRSIRQDDIADLVEERQKLLKPYPPAHARPATVSMETYLMDTPDLTDEQRAALVVMARALRG